jgi:CO/xanthine dehydrogenase FAD-binding subunit
VIDEFNYTNPACLNDTYSLLKSGQNWPLAGATDLIPKMRRMKLPVDTLVDISRFAELDFISELQGRIEIGSLSTHSTLVEDQCLQEVAVSLVEAAASIGCQQTRNRGTIGGNIANASPAGDTLPPLLTFDAVVQLGSLEGKRKIPLSEFLVGPGKTKLADGELIESISFAVLEGYGLSFLKLGKRNGMSISIASVATAIVLDNNGSVRDARIAMGSVAPTAIRCYEAEKVLIGKTPSKDLFKQASEVVADHIVPIGDVRASAAYRQATASGLVAQALIIAEGRLK